MLATIAFLCIEAHTRAKRPKRYKSTTTSELASGIVENEATWVSPRGTIVGQMFVKCYTTDGVAPATHGAGSSPNSQGSLTAANKCANICDGMCARIRNVASQVSH